MSKPNFFTIPRFKKILNRFGMFHDASIILSKHILNQIFETFLDKSKNLRMPAFFYLFGHILLCSMLL